MEIKYGVKACPTERQLWLLYKTVGKYMCVGFANMNSGWLVPVWRKWK